MKKIVLITGASSGIGKETSILLANNGYKVYAVARRIERLKELEKFGITPFSVDITNNSSVENCVKQIVETEGRIDILINNAGYGEYGAIEDVDIEKAKYQFEVNVFSLARLTQLVIPYMRKQRFGKIVNITSIGGKMATPLGGWYHASKFAVEGLSDSLRLELKPFGVNVIIIEPGGVKTEWGQIAFDNLKTASNSSAYNDLADKAKRVYEITAKKNIEPIEIAELIKGTIEAKKPKARYSKGFLAKPTILAKKILSDSLFDKIIMSQLR